MNAFIPLLILIGQLALKYGDNIVEALKFLLKEDIDITDIQRLRDLVKPPEDYLKQDLPWRVKGVNRADLLHEKTKMGVSPYPGPDLTNRDLRINTKLIYHAQKE